MHAGHDDVISVCADAEALLRAGRNSEARKAARAALYTDGPDPRLYALLGRAHAAEADEQHTDRAEAILSEGLAVFPDDPGLLAAYAKLRAAHPQSPEPAEPSRELSPEDPRAVDPEQAGQGIPRGDREAGATSPGRQQRHDARLVLAVIGHPMGAAQQAAGQARARPNDDRIAVLAESLTALARPGRAPLRLLVRAPLAAGIGCWAWFAAWLLGVAALHLPAWAALAALPGPALFPLLHGVLRGARRRAGDRVPAAPAAASAPGAFPALPPVPPYTRREKTAAAVVLVMVAVALAVFALGA
ncbi:hypothetical protein [Streptomyces sp. NPDC052811]|uniref:hypothetical protein n=1 Tax=Streptomyces sp. NPDC052811 TaxID=3155731 RepID=UPI00342897C2